VWSSINETVIAAKDGMDWLQDCARELAKENLPIIWTTVDGMPIMQNYNDMRKRRVKTKFKDTLIYLTVQEAIKNKLDTRRQGSGISPNWVHANDSCHLRMSVNLAAYNGVTHFGVIHDSFSCHASDVEMFGACLREAFIDMYVNHDPLQMFKDEGEALLGKPLPDMPAKGTLDVTVVRDSEFFFA
jgi:DNA-directed RNA polymerase